MGSQRPQVVFLSKISVMLLMPIFWDMIPSSLVHQLGTLALILSDLELFGMIGCTTLYPILIYLERKLPYSELVINNPTMTTSVMPPEKSMIYLRPRDVKCLVLHQQMAMIIQSPKL